MGKACWTKRIESALLLLPFALLGCEAPPKASLPKGPLYFLDSLEAAAQVQKDAATEYFQRIRPLDMRLQMGRAAPSDSLGRDSLLGLYRAFLARQVRSFSTEEAQLLRGLLRQAYGLVEALPPGLWPDTVRLAKISGKAYGPEAFYTREKCIMLPAEQLAATNRARLLPVLLHELFHIYSRYHPEQQRRLYKMIGFRAIRKKLQWADSLDQLILLNPDGVNWRYRIQLKYQGRDRPFVPLLTARYLNATTLPYLEHLAFGLHPLEEGEEEKWRIVPEAVPLGELPAFYEKVGDNTDYIIHPDEILADNFVLLALSHSEAPHYQPQQLSEEGKALLQEMEAAFARWGE